MQLPGHLKKKAIVVPKSKYSDASVKMLVTALDDLHMIKFKAGWFTLIKFDHEIKEKQNLALRQELIENSKTKIRKPNTWIRKLTIENRFIGEVIEPRQDEKPKS
jgi:hypothetical protein